MSWRASTPEWILPLVRSQLVEGSTREPDLVGCRALVIAAWPAARRLHVWDGRHVLRVSLPPAAAAELDRDEDGLGITLRNLRGHCVALSGVSLAPDLYAAPPAVVASATRVTHYCDKEQLPRGAPPFVEADPAVARFLANLAAPYFDSYKVPDFSRPAALASAPPDLNAWSEGPGVPEPPRGLCDRVVDFARSLAPRAALSGRKPPPPAARVARSTAVDVAANSNATAAARTSLVDAGAVARAGESVPPGKTAAPAGAAPPGDRDATRSPASCQSDGDRAVDAAVMTQRNSRYKDLSSSSESDSDPALTLEFANGENDHVGDEQGANSSADNNSNTESADQAPEPKTEENILHSDHCEELGSVEPEGEENSDNSSRDGSVRDEGVHESSDSARELDVGRSRFVATRGDVSAGENVGTGAVSGEAADVTDCGVLPLEAGKQLGATENYAHKVSRLSRSSGIARISRGGNERRALPLAQKGCVSDPEEITVKSCPRSEDADSNHPRGMRKVVREENTVRVGETVELAALQSGNGVQRDHDRHASSSGQLRPVLIDAEADGAFSADVSDGVPLRKVAETSLLSRNPHEAGGGPLKKRALNQSRELDGDASSVAVVSLASNENVVRTSHRQTVEGAPILSRRAAGVSGVLKEIVLKNTLRTDGDEARVVPGQEEEAKSSSSSGADSPDSHSNIESDRLQNSRGGLGAHVASPNRLAHAKDVAGPISHRSVRNGKNECGEMSTSDNEEFSLTPWNKSATPERDEKAPTSKPDCLAQPDGCARSVGTGRMTGSSNEADADDRMDALVCYEESGKSGYESSVESSDPDFRAVAVETQRHSLPDDQDMGNIPENSQSSADLGHVDVGRVRCRRPDLATGMDMASNGVVSPAVPPKRVSQMLRRLSIHAAKLNENAVHGTQGDEILPAGSGEEARSPGRVRTQRSFSSPQKAGAGSPAKAMGRPRGLSWRKKPPKKLRNLADYLYAETFAMKEHEFFGEPVSNFVFSDDDVRVDHLHRMERRGPAPIQFPKANGRSGTVGLEVEFIRPGPAELFSGPKRESLSESSASAAEEAKSELPEDRVDGNKIGRVYECAASLLGRFDALEEARRINPWLACLAPKHVMDSSRPTEPLLASFRAQANLRRRQSLAAVEEKQLCNNENGSNRRGSLPSGAITGSDRKNVDFPGTVDAPKIVDAVETRAQAGASSTRQTERRQSRSKRSRTGNYDEDPDYRPSRRGGKRQRQIW